MANILELVKTRNDVSVRNKVPFPLKVEDGKLVYVEFNEDGSVKDPFLVLEVTQLNHIQMDGLREKALIKAESKGVQTKGELFDTYLAQMFCQKLKENLVRWDTSDGSVLSREDVEMLIDNLSDSEKVLQHSLYKRALWDDLLAAKKAREDGRDFLAQESARA